MEFQSVVLDDEKNAVIILDQTKLPLKQEYLKLTTVEQLWEAVRALRVRGAPAIGIAAAFGVYIALKQYNTQSREEFYNKFKKFRDYLESARPTAVNLFWALDAMERVITEYRGDNINELKSRLLAAAKDIARKDAEVCRKIGEHGLSLIRDCRGILTHCNAGALATARYGTALAPVYLGRENGCSFHVYVDETRPLLQGARLTAFELSRAGIDFTLICDNMAASVIKSGNVDAVLVGCDRVAINGDTANKIGTLGVAILAKHYNIPFYVCAPVSSIDPDTAAGADIVIEQRAPEEVTEAWYKNKMAPEGAAVFNPAFDVTDAELISAFITEKGIVYPPFEEGLKRIIGGSL
ncbi:MAG: S-methyl-5-thioribose-1-phosphate isomerase [Clostridiales bacterium]|jgi:methylthioribose-1-phosphate isomerase|nr:S-methyl-5-thioribose-1-phosphate isomerase [Clostridiales bacterium]